MLLTISTWLVFSVSVSDYFDIDELWFLLSPAEEIDPDDATINLISISGQYINLQYPPLSARLIFSTSNTTEHNNLH